MVVTLHSNSGAEAGFVYNVSGLDREDNADEVGMKVELLRSEEVEFVLDKIKDVREGTNDGRGGIEET